MTRDQFTKLRDILLVAPTLAEGELTAYLDEICGADVELRTEAESLLSVDTEVPSIISDGGLATLAGQAFAPISEKMPEYIGPYRLLEVAGEGGMGVVYRAQQEEPIRREVAIKLMRVRSRPQALDRFLAERQTLARMAHPNIASIFDAGISDDGRPYLAMEYVQGTSITEYCTQKNLSQRARIELFLKACLGVQHAHLKGVIHRDLKPANVLVSDDRGETQLKIIDFGIARSLVEETDTDFRTLDGQVLGTPEFMSPEQALGNPDEVDTRTDVYSLGVILYHLLVDRLPHDFEGLSVVAKLKCIGEKQIDPLRSNGTDANLDADLITVVHRALEKDVDERYASAEAFAADLRHYLADEPVVARPPSRAYLLQKLIKRHRGVFVSLCTIISLLLIFSVTTAIMFASQQQAKRSAEQEASKAKATSKFLSEVLTSVRTDRSGHEVTVDQILDTSSKRIESELDGFPVAQAAVGIAIGNAYSSLGHHEKSKDRYILAVEKLRENLPADDPQIADALDALATAYYYLGQFPASITAESTSFELRVQGDPSQYGIGTTLNNLGRLLEHGWQFEKSEKRYLASIAHFEKYGYERNSDRTYVVAVDNIAKMYLDWGRLAKSAQAYQKSVAVRTEILGPGNNWTILAQGAYCQTLREQGYFAAIDSVLIEVEKTCLAADPAIPVPEFLRLRGMIQFDLGSLGEAESFLTVALDRVAERVGVGHPGLTGRQFELAEVLVRTGQTTEAIKLCRNGVAIRDSLDGVHHPRYGEALAILGEVLVIAGEEKEAAHVLRNSLEIFEANGHQGHWMTAFANLWLARSLSLQNRQGEAQMALQKYEQAKGSLPFGDRLRCDEQAFLVRK